MYQSYNFYIFLSYLVFFLFISGVSCYFIYNLKKSVKISSIINKREKIDRT